MRHPPTHFGRRSRANPTTDAEHLRNTALAVGGIALAMGVVYLIYKSVSTAQAAQETQAAAGTLTSSGDQPILMGPGGSSSPIGGAAGSSYDPHFINAPGPQGPMSGPLPSPGA